MTSTSTNLHIDLDVTYAIDHGTSDLDNGVYSVDFSAAGLPTIRKTLSTADFPEGVDPKSLMIQYAPYDEWYRSNPEVFPQARTIVYPFSLLPE